MAKFQYGDERKKCCFDLFSRHVPALIFSFSLVYEHQYIKVNVSAVRLNQFNMLQQPSTDDNKRFRTLVLYLKKLYPSWKAKELTEFLVQSENPPHFTTRRSLWLKIWRILQRNSIGDLSRSGAPRTVSTINYIRSVKEAIELKTNATIRNVNANLKRQVVGYDEQRLN